MASAVTDDDMAFDLHSALTSYRLATTDEERSQAGRHLRSEMERQKLRLEAAHVSQRATREREYLRELVQLEEQLRRDLLEKDKVTAVRRACLDLCLSKLDTDPDQAALYGNVILSWSADTRSGTPDRDEICKAIKHVKDETKKSIEHVREEIDKSINDLVAPTHSIMHHLRVGRPAVQVARMKPEDVKEMSANLHLILKNRGYTIPTSELFAGISATVRIEKAKSSKVKKWKDIVGAATMAVSVVSSVVTTVEAIKHVTPDDIEPLLNCRHHMPDGWFF